MPLVPLVPLVRLCSPRDVTCLLLAGPQPGYPSAILNKKVNDSYSGLQIANSHCFTTTIYSHEAIHGYNSSGFRYYFKAQPRFSTPPAYKSFHL